MEDTEDISGFKSGKPDSISDEGGNYKYCRRGDSNPHILADTTP